jgi:hypothetical protein
MVGELNIASELTIGMGPTDHERTLARRWNEARQELLALEQPPPDATQDTLFDAQRRMHSLFIELWALREAAIRQGVSAPTVNAALKSDQDGMALAHDLGNVAKHGPLKNPPMSGHKPTFDGLMAERPGSGGQWRLKIKIQHGPDERDGLTVARRAVDGWEALLKTWNVL